MAQKNNGIKVLFFLVLVVCIVCAATLFLVPTCQSTLSPVLSSENENFLTLQQKYARQQERIILNLLEPVVGRGHVRASVRLDLNLKNARHNLHTYTPQPEKGVISQQVSEKEIQNLIQKQNVSIIIDGNTRKGDNGIYQARTGQEMANYKRLVQSGIGFDSQRGDTLEIINMPFVKRLHSKSNSIFLFIIALLLIGAGLSFISMSFAHCAHSWRKEAKAMQFSTDILDKITDNPTRAISVIKNWIYMPVSSKGSDWTPIQKVGIILLALDESVVRQILIALDDNEVRRVAKTMTTLGVIPPQESARVLTELYDAMTNGSAVVGNPTRVQQILAESPKEETLKFKETLQPTNSSLWDEFAALNSETLAPRLSNLRPEIVAYILYRLPAEKASDLLQNLPDNRVTQILIHLSHIGYISNTTSAKMEQEALVIARNILNTVHTPTGTEKTSDILSCMAKTPKAQSVLKDLNQSEPFLARKLAAKLIRFDDLSHWPDEVIQTILRHTPRATAILALVNAPDSVMQTIQHSIPDSLWPQLQEEIKQKGKSVRPEQIEQAREQMIETTRTLLNQGKIQL
ncbi:MAG: hypothetical protein II938_00390 [Alphaproteobacteria bacterium]|nr:hypothetical protein [Alphaproteobacteria bacterium]